MENKRKVLSISGGLLLLMIASMFVNPIYACDGCGPSNTGNYIGVLPNVRNNFIGLRYNDRAFTTYPYLNSHNAYTKETRDRYFSVEAWGRFYLTPRLQVIGLVPYAYHTRNEGGKLTEINGLGDAVAMGTYTVYSTPDSSGKNWLHFLQAGTGVKLPTGNYQNSENGHVYHANFQIGSGSTDLLGNIVYTIRYRKMGFRTDLGYKYNTSNVDGYQFGDRITNSSCFFYWASIGLNDAFVPQIGLYQEFAQKDISNRYYEPNTGGASRMFHASAELYVSRFSIGANFMYPIQQPDYDYPTKMKHSLRLNFNYFISKK